MDKLRLVYSQLGRAAWCSHLDTMRTIQRALNRADIPIRYSEGFNPHALISILMPLSVGTESLCQIADIRVREDVDIAALPGRLTAALPEGFEVTACYEEACKSADVKWLIADGSWEYDDRDSEKAAEACRALFSQPVDVMRRTKRGEGLFRITDHIRELTFTPDGGTLRIHAVVSCTEPTVNPTLLTDCVSAHLPEWKPDYARFCRVGLLKADGTKYF